MTMLFVESAVEDPARPWLVARGYAAIRAPDIFAGELDAERRNPNDRDAELERRLRLALVGLSSGLSPEQVADAVCQLRLPASPSPVERNRGLRRLVAQCGPFVRQREDGRIASPCGG